VRLWLSTLAFLPAKRCQGVLVETARQLSENLGYSGPEQAKKLTEGGVPMAEPEAAFAAARRFVMP